MYVLMDYCEDTCTTQDEIYNSVLLDPDMEALLDMFAEEGFMEWFPETSFTCVSPRSEEFYGEELYEDDDDRSLTCVEQYWKSLCEKHDVEFSEFLATV